MRRGLAAVLLAGVLIGACGGGGGGGHPGGAAPAAPLVTLRLKGASKERRSACGATHRTARYAGAATIRFAGAVTPIPPGRYKVRVKVKACRAGAFSPVAEVKAVLRRPEGTFSGTLPKLPRGTYFARAAVLVQTRRVARSEKRHFAIG